MTAPVVGHPRRDPPERDLLVLTGGGRSGHCGLALPFRDARVIEVDGGRDRTGITGTFDTVVIERDDLDADRLAALAAAATAVLRPGGHLFVALCPGVTGTDRGGTPPAWLEGLRWQGVRVVDGLPFAVLAVAGDGGDPPGVTVARMAAAAVTAQAVGGAVALSQPDSAAWALAHERDQRHHSELALLAHLEFVATALERERARHTVPELVRSVLRRRRAGQAVLRVARRVRAAARRLRAAARGI